MSGLYEEWHSSGKPTLILRFRGAHAPSPKIRAEAGWVGPLGFC